MLLPRLRPGRYAVIRPPGALAHRAGHAWEQLALPAAARRAELLLSPANLAPLAHPRNVVVIHDVRAIPRSRPGTGAPTARWHRAAPARGSRAAPGS